MYWHLLVIHRHLLAIWILRKYTHLLKFGWKFAVDFFCPGTVHIVDTCLPTCVCEDLGGTRGCKMVGNSTPNQGRSKDFEKVGAQGANFLNHICSDIDVQLFLSHMD